MSNASRVTWVTVWPSRSSRQIWLLRSLMKYSGAASTSAGGAVGATVGPAVGPLVGGLVTTTAVGVGGWVGATTCPCTPISPQAASIKANIVKNRTLFMGYL